MKNVVLLKIKDTTTIKIQCPGCKKIITATHTILEDTESIFSHFSKCPKCKYQINQSEFKGVKEKTFMQKVRGFFSNIEFDKKACPWF